MRVFGSEEPIRFLEILEIWLTRLFSTYFGSEPLQFHQSEMWDFPPILMFSQVVGPWRIWKWDMEYFNKYHTLIFCNNYYYKNLQLDFLGEIFRKRVKMFIYGLILDDLVWKWNTCNLYLQLATCNGQNESAGRETF